MSLFMFQFMLTFNLFIVIMLYKNKNIIKFSFILIFFLFLYNLLENKNYNFFFSVFMFDWYNLCFMFVLLFVSLMIYFYSYWYFISEPKKYYFFLYLSMFMFFMYLFFTFNSILWMLLGWEGISFLSYLLINWWYSRSEAGVCASQAVIYNRISDFFIYFFLIILSNYSMFLNGKSFFMYFFFFFMILSMMSKSSLFFFHPWLPNAMESPTPVSSLLHSSTMVVASIFLYIRFINLFNSSVMNFFCLIGSLTMMYSSVCSLIQNDIKKIIAYSTTSQLSFMILIVSFLSSFYSMLFLIFHAFFKSLLFLMSGLFIHESNSNQNMSKMNVFNSKLSSYSFIVSLLSLMSMPFMSSFFSKDLILENIWSEFMNCFIIFIFFFSCGFTIAYSIKLMMKYDLYISLNTMMLKLSDNLFWIFSLSFFVLMNSIFFNFFLNDEMLLKLNYKMLTLLLFILSMFFFFFKNINKFMLFYNPLNHRLMVYYILKIYNYIMMIEFKWLEMKFKNLKIPFFYSMKFLFIFVLIVSFINWM